MGGFHASGIFADSDTVAQNACGALSFIRYSAGTAAITAHVNGKHGPPDDCSFAAENEMRYNGQHELGCD